jgi:hypothetical protein
MKKAMVMVMSGDGKEKKTHTSFFFGAPENHCNKPLDPTKPQTPKQKQQQQQQQQQHEKKEQNRTEAERDNNNTSIAILSSSEPMAANVIPVSQKNKNKRLLSAYLFCLCCFSSSVSLVKQ